MYIQIGEKGSLSLKEMHDKMSFSIRECQAAIEPALIQNALSEFVQADEDDHYWLEAEAVIALSGERSDSQWVTDFWIMLAAVEPYGYYDKETKRVKAHLERKAGL